MRKDLDGSGSGSGGVHNRAEVNGLLSSGAQIGEYAMSSGAPGYDVYVNQYTTTPENRIDYDQNGNLIRYEAQSSGGMTLDLLMGEEEGPQSVRDSAADAIALGGLALDFTADQQVDSKDAEVALELMTTGGLGGLPRVATLRYDYRNQMVEYEDDEYISNPTVYIYDCFGRRVMKKVYNPAAYVPANIRYVSGGNTSSAAMWQTLEEWDMDEDEVYVSYVYGNYIDEVLSMRKDIDGAGETHDVEEYYFHADDLFNVVLITDESGDAVERYEYGDYGAPFYYDGSGDWIPHSILNNTRLFNGREWDQETRFYYYRTRYLEPTMGRFTTRDTIGVWGDAGNHGNAITYVASMPLNLADPYGLMGYLPYYAPLQYAPTGLNPAEIHEIKKGVEIWDLWDLRRAVKDARDGSDHLPGRDGGVGDAVRHCIRACENNRRLGPRGKDFDDAHERGVPERYTGEQDMDLHNNEVGRKLWDQLFGRNLKLALGCDFDVPTDPSDKRFNGHCEAACMSALRDGKLKIKFPHKPVIIEGIQ